MHESDLHIFDKYLNAFWWEGAEELNEPDSFFCNFCESYRPASVDHEISKSWSLFDLATKTFCKPS